MLALPGHTSKQGTSTNQKPLDRKTPIQVSALAGLHTGLCDPVYIAGMTQLVLLSREYDRFPQAILAALEPSLPPLQRPSPVRTLSLAS